MTLRSKIKHLFYSCSNTFRSIFQSISIGTGSWVSLLAIVSTTKGAGTVEIGKNCEIHPYCVLNAYSGFIRIGQDCSLNSFCHLGGQFGLTIGNGVRIGPGVMIVAANHQPGDSEAALREKPIVGRGIVIEDNVWIGGGACILDGVVIGKNSIVGAGAVVTKNVSPATTVAGVPASPLLLQTSE